MKKKLYPILSLLFFCHLSAAALAQAPAPASTGVVQTTPSAVETPAGVTEKTTASKQGEPFMGSFFLSPAEIAAIERAMRGTPSSVPSAVSQVHTHRVISISGVFYSSPENWVVWMNGQKVTPKRLLPEIIDIAVKDSSQVHLKWYDDELRKVLIITLRPHQTYDIPTGILLPGSQ